MTALTWIFVSAIMIAIGFLLLWRWIVLTTSELLDQDPPVYAHLREDERAGGE
ncbi:hypothetical protein [Paracoccus beibuensis]|uniref:hypothetical protein n=1 Tax=Paracoccus beibuensis TaxID=547602 RepID=UPI00223F49DF|nr:hypothetical protein [Paracoccus beibuensis]